MNINDLMNMDMSQFQNSGMGGNVSYSVSSFSTTTKTTNGDHTEYSSKAYKNKVNYDGSGNQPHREFFTNKTAGVFDNGHKMEESQSSYQNNSTGEYKAAHQRKLDDKGVRLIKEKNFKTGDENSDSVYKGFDEGNIFLAFLNLLFSFFLNPIIKLINKIFFHELMIKITFQLI